MNNPTTRPFDEQQEKIVTRFLKEKFFDVRYPGVTSIVTDKRRQVAGIDMVSSGINYDLKAQSSKNYLGDPRPTFSLELSYYDRTGHLCEGWFTKKGLETDAYIFVWFPEVRKNKWGGLSSPEDIIKAEVMVVDKRRLERMIYGICPKPTVYSMQRLIRSNKDYRWENQGVKLCYSSYLHERPINLVVKKEVLAACASQHCFIGQNYIKNIYH